MWCIVAPEAVKKKKNKSYFMAMIVLVQYTGGEQNFVYFTSSMTPHLSMRLRQCYHQQVSCQSLQLSGVPVTSELMLSEKSCNIKQFIHHHFTQAVLSVDAESYSNSYARLSLKLSQTRQQQRLSANTDVSERKLANLVTCGLSTE